MQYNYPGDHISISSLQKFDNCPFSFFMRYVCGIKLPPKDKMKDGLQFQLALNALYKGEDPTPLIKEMDPKKRGIATLLIGKANHFNDIISIDEPYTIDFGLDIPMIFIPDLLTKNEIVENKFTSGYYNSKMVLSERQRIVYYAGVRKLLGLDLKVKYQIFNTKNKTAEIVEAPVNNNDINDLIKWIDVKLKEITMCMSNGIWDNGGHSWCDYNFVCPLASKYPKQWGKK